jgi:hypothetical protein
MQKLRLVLLAALIGATAACGGSGTPASTTANTIVTPQPLGPEAVLTKLLQELWASNYSATSDLVDEAQLGLLAAIEVPDATALLSYEDRGLSSQARDNFWSAFAASLPGLVDAEPDSIAATIDRQFATDGVRFAIGSIRFGVQEISGVFVLRLVDDRWELDPIATFGGPFVAPIRNWLRTSPPEQVAPVSDLLRRDAPSWRLLADLQTDEIEAGIAIKSEVDDLLIEIGASFPEGGS